MKAKEWAAKLTEAGDQKDEVLKAFVEEIGATAKGRGGSAMATEGAVREQRAKWLAVCRECPSVSPDMFPALLESYGPEFKKAEETAKAQAAKGGDAGDRPAHGRRLGGKGRPR